MPIQLNLELVKFKVHQSYIFSSSKVQEYLVREPSLFGEKIPSVNGLFIQFISYLGDKSLYVRRMVQAIKKPLVNCTAIRKSV